MLKKLFALLAVMVAFAAVEAQAASLSRVLNFNPSTLEEASSTVGSQLPSDISAILNNIFGQLGSGSHSGGGSGGGSASGGCCTPPTFDHCGIPMWGGGCHQPPGGGFSGGIDINITINIVIIIIEGNFCGGHSSCCCCWGF